MTDWYAGIDRREQLQSQIDANEAQLAGTVVALCDGESEPVAGAAQLLDLAVGQVQAMRARHKKQSREPSQPGGVALVPSADEQGPAEDVVAS